MTRDARRRAATIAKNVSGTTPATSLALACLTLATALGQAGCGASAATTARQTTTERPAPGGRRAEAPPNLVVILADDLGYGDLGVYGSEHIRTPAIDALAARGVRFTAGYVAAAVCSPSRAGLMTGRYPQRFGYEFNPSGKPDYGLPVSEVTLAERLAEAGYATGAFGKWQLGWDGGRHPLDRGFDEFFGMQSGTIYISPDAPDTESWSPLPIASDRSRRPLYRGREIVEEDAYLTDALTREALSFIDRHREEPFFLYLAHYAPHVPLQATQTYLEPYSHIEDPKTRIYAAMVSALDASVDRVMDKLRETGLAERTLIVFLSDNGCALYTRGACSNGPLRGGKRYFFEGGVRVPFMLSWPGRVPAGRVYEEPVISLDLVPTLLAAAGLSPPESTDGVDLIPFLDGTRNGAPHRILRWRAGPNRAVRRGRWKLWQVNRSENGPSELGIEPGGLLPDWEAPRGSPHGRLDLLYDLGDDVGETDNLIDERRPIAVELAGELDAWEKELAEPMWWSDRGTVTVIDGVPVELVF